jgi:GTP-binding protein EngB required for normal cell division
MVVASSKTRYAVWVATGHSSFHTTLTSLQILKFLKREMLRLRPRPVIAASSRCRTLNALLCTATEAESKRKAFRAVPLDMNLMNKLDIMNIGTLPNRKMRVAISSKLNLNETRNAAVKSGKKAVDNLARPVPFPFHCVGKVIHTAHDRTTIPNSFPGEPPEISLVGRSNVGKSTLINALLKFDKSYVQKAIVSEKPGETKYLTFFELGQSFKPPKGQQTLSDPATKTIKGEDGKLKPYVDKTSALMLVDMPGYGFAFMSAEDKMRAHYLCLDYLVSNVNRNKVLKRVVLLVDGRHGIKATDALFLQDLQRHLLDTIANGDYGQDSVEAKTILAALPSGSSARSSLAPEADHSADADTTPVTGTHLTGKQIKMLSKHLGWKLQIVLTKCDLVERADLCRRIQTISDVVQQRVPALYHSMLPTLALSAKQLRGVEEIQRELAALVPPIWEGAPNYYKPAVDGEGNVVPKNPENALLRSKKGSDERLSFAERRKQREAELLAEKDGKGAEKAQTTKVAVKADSRDKKADSKAKVKGAAEDKPKKGDGKEAKRSEGVTKDKKTQLKTEFENAQKLAAAAKPSRQPGAEEKNGGQAGRDQKVASDLPMAPGRAAKILSYDSSDDDDAASGPAGQRKSGRVRPPAPKRAIRSDRDRILKDYGDEIEGYFKGKDVQLDE